MDTGFQLAYLLVNCPKANAFFTNNFKQIEDPSGHGFLFPLFCNIPLEKIECGEVLYAEAVIDQIMNGFSNCNFMFQDLFEDAPQSLV